MFLLGNIIGDVGITLIASISLSVVIHKSVLRGIGTAVALVIVTYIFILIGSSSEDAGYVLFALQLMIIPFLLGLCIIGVFLRGFFRISSIILKIFILILPFLIVGLIVTNAVSNAGNLTFTDCNNRFKPFEYVYSCFNKLPEIVKDSAVCQHVTNGQHSSFCYTAYAVANKDIALCQKIDAINNYGCYSRVASSLDDPTVCEDISISNSKDKDSCYYGVSNGLNDVSLCEKILDERLRKSCRK
jgi:hypothetical protein